MAETIEAEQARTEVASNELFVLDVREEEDWSENTERLPGSFHIAAEEVDSQLDELPEDQRILLVCGDGKLSAEVAERLGSEREVVVLADGVEGWKSAGLLTQPSPDAESPKGRDDPPLEGSEEDSENGDDPELDNESSTERNRQ